MNFPIPSPQAVTHPVMEGNASVRAGGGRGFFRGVRRISGFTSVFTFILYYPPLSYHLSLLVHSSDLL